LDKHPVAGEIEFPSDAGRMSIYGSDATSEPDRHPSGSKPTIITGIFHQTTVRSSPSVTRETVTRRMTMVDFLAQLIGTLIIPVFFAHFCIKQPRPHFLATFAAGVVGFIVATLVLAAFKLVHLITTSGHDLDFACSVVGGIFAYYYGNRFRTKVLLTRQGLIDPQVVNDRKAD
jgi:hypothetical protein